MTEGPAAPTPNDAGTGNGRSLSELAKDPRLSVTRAARDRRADRARGLARRGVGGGRQLQRRRAGRPSDRAGGGQRERPRHAGGRQRGSPIYWVGPRQGRCTSCRSAGRQIYVRYLPSGVKAGDAQALLTVATYPVENAYDVTSAISGCGRDADSPRGRRRDQQEPAHERLRRVSRTSTTRSRSTTPTRRW